MIVGRVCFVHETAGCIGVVVLVDDVTLEDLKLSEEGGEGDGFVD